ncbi:hypothetical protein BHM03_00018817 [Ensete ventricosum]|nr:hypothetical protein BHM03_00018817 [Ensete ventricosum]
MGQDQVWASGRGLDDAVRLRHEFARRFAEGIRKLARNTPGDCGKKIVRLVARMLEAIGLAGISATEPSMSDGCTIVVQDFWQLSAVEPPVS